MDHWNSSVLVRISADQTPLGEQRGVTKKGKRQATEPEKVFATHKSDQGLVWRIYEELLQVNNRKRLRPHPPVTLSPGVWAAPSDKEKTAGDGRLPSGLVTRPRWSASSFLLPPILRGAPAALRAGPLDKEPRSLANNQCGPEATATDVSLEADPTPVQPWGDWSPGWHFCSLTKDEVGGEWGATALDFWDIPAWRDPALQGERRGQPRRTRLRTSPAAAVSLPYTGSLAVSNLVPLWVNVEVSRLPLPHHLQTSSLSEDPESDFNWFLDT